MTKRKTLYELAQRYIQVRERHAALAKTPEGHWVLEKSRFRADLLRTELALYKAGAALDPGALMPSLVRQTRKETLDEIEALARKRGEGLFDVLEILAIMRSNHGKT